jgi:uncharacterized membrane protein YadS
MGRRETIKRLIHKPIDMTTTAVATVAIFGIIYIAMIPYLLGIRVAKSTDYGHLDD